MDSVKKMSEIAHQAKMSLERHNHLLTQKLFALEFRLREQSELIENYESQEVGLLDQNAKLVADNEMLREELKQLLNYNKVLLQQQNQRN